MVRPIVELGAWVLGGKEPDQEVSKLFTIRLWRPCSVMRLYVSMTHLPT